MARWEDVLDEIVRTRRRALVGRACLLASYSLQQQDGSWGAENVTPGGGGVYSGWLVSAPVALTIT